MSVKLLTEHHLEFISLKGGCTGSSESTLVLEITCHCSVVFEMMQFNYFEDDFRQCHLLSSADNSYLIVIPWVVRLYGEIIQEL